MTLAAALKFYQQLLAPSTDLAEAQAMTTLLLEQVLEIDRSEFHKMRSSSLNDEQTERLSAYVDRILADEPLQYVLGEAWFCGLKLKVDRHVLIPRPETEELVEWIIANCRFPVSALSILDICTGSGCIALALKRRIRKATVTAIDVDPLALQVARTNAKELGIDIECLQGDLLNPSICSTLPLFDIIVSNPPYVTRLEEASMSPTVLDYEPHLALFAPESDPLVFYKRLATLAKEKLSPEGQLFAELNPARAEEISAIFIANDLQVSIKKDMQEKERMLRAWR